MIGNCEGVVIPWKNSSSNLYFPLHDPSVDPHERRLFCLILHLIGLWFLHSSSLLSQFATHADEAFLYHAMILNGLLVCPITNPKLPKREDLTFSISSVVALCVNLFQVATNQSMPCLLFSKLVHDASPSAWNILLADFPLGSNR